MALYKVVDRRSRYQYALEIIARSFVYHRADGPCVRKKHRIISIKELRDEASGGRWKYLYPCKRSDCAPADIEHMNGTDRIAEEQPDTHLYLCTRAADILARLYQHSGHISELAAQLLRTAAKEDPSIELAWKRMRRV